MLDAMIGRRIQSEATAKVISNNYTGKANPVTGHESP
jgi:hypothetical protein